MKLGKIKNQIFLGIILLLFIFFFNFFKKEIKNFFYFLSLPIQKALWTGGEKISDFFEGILEIKNLKKENDKLKLKIQELWAENVSLKELKKENETLREALNLGLEKEFQMVLCQVLARDDSSDLILVNKGLKDGIKKGLPVITPQKILVGKVIETYNNFSKVQLLSAKGFSFDVEILDKEIYGLVKGNGNFLLSLELIPKEKEIKIGDKIVTSALGGNFPKGLLVGEVEEVKKTDAAFFQGAKIKLAFQPKDLNELFIITNFGIFERND